MEKSLCEIPLLCMYNRITVMLIVQNSVTVDEQELLNEVKSYLLTAIEDKKAFADKLMKQYQKHKQQMLMCQN